MPQALSRFSLLRGHLRPESPPVRPPWARPNGRFESLCDGCGACRDACPEGIIRAGRGGLPELDFDKHPCSLCGDCVAACPTGALAEAVQRPFPGVARIAAACLSVQGIACRLCEEHCDARAIRFRPALGGRVLPEIDTQTCTGCGGCIHVCPAEAVTIQELTTCPAA